MEGLPGVTTMVGLLVWGPFLYTQVVLGAVERVWHLDIPGPADGSAGVLTAHRLVIGADHPVEVRPVGWALLGRAVVIRGITVEVLIALPRVGDHVQDSIALDLAHWGSATCLTFCPRHAFPNKRVKYPHWRLTDHGELRNHTDVDADMELGAVPRILHLVTPHVVGTVRVAEN